jgi:hypothetical protein
MSRIPVSDADKKKSYYKYLLRPMAPGPKESFDAITDEPHDNKLALRVHDRNRLFDPGDLPDPIGWWLLEDGTAIVANRIFFPGSTGEMFDWWFAWHPLDRLRYGIWDPEDHFDVYLQDKAKALDMSKSMRERHWGSVHYVWETIGPDSGMDMVQLNFMRPGELGYDESKIDTDACNALICSNNHTFGRADHADLPVTMVHFLRPVKGGSELRSYFWFGWQIENEKPVKRLPAGVTIPAKLPKSLLQHSTVEYANLAAMLPEIYAKEKDNW